MTVEIKWKCGHEDSVYTFANDEEIPQIKQWYAQRKCEKCEGK